MPQNNIDLNDPKAKAKVEWSTVETAAEEAARIVREDREHRFQIQMRWAMFAASAIAVAAGGGIGGYLALNGSTPELARLGVGILAAVVTGALGFISGRASATPGK